MLRIEYVYWLIGAFLAACAWRDFAARRWTMAAFWAVIACAFVFGDAIKQATAGGTRWPAQLMGAGVIALGLLAATARTFGKTAGATNGSGTASGAETSRVEAAIQPGYASAAFALGMVAFTMVMGNAFAAFPVMMAGIGLPLLIAKHGAMPAALGSIGMLTGYCGTLLTPMAANFNIVPAVLLELRDQYAVIRVQVPTALALLSVNVVLMVMLIFR